MLAIQSFFTIIKKYGGSKRAQAVSVLAVPG
jgi:hypothetical protein